MKFTSFKSTQRDSNYCLLSEVFKNVGQACTAPALCLQSVHISNAPSIEVGIISIGRWDGEGEIQVQ